MSAGARLDGRRLLSPFMPGWRWIVSFMRGLILSSILALATGAPLFAQEPPDPTPPTPEEQELWWKIREQDGLSHASGARPELGLPLIGTPTQAIVTLRVGLHYSFTATGARSEFASLHHPFVQVSNTDGNALVIDRSTGQTILTIAPGNVIGVRYTSAGYTVSDTAGDLGTFAGPIWFRGMIEQNRFRIDSIERTNILASGFVRPTYRGSIEIARGPSTLADRVNLVNILELEEYVRGVVVNESPAFFHIEALKAQATAARGYAVSNVGRYGRLGYPFDLVDSAASQVYRGVAAEHANAIRATEETRGLVASYEGSIIVAFYSSSFGGHSDSVEWIFNTPTTQWPGTNVTPYLSAIHDGETPAPDLDDPSTRDWFWMNAQPPTFDACDRVANRFARWRISVPGSAIKARLTTGRYQLVSGDLSGTVNGIEVLQRMSGSGRIAAVRISLTSGVVDVLGWDNLRRVIGTTADATTLDPCTNRPIANAFVLNNPSVIEPFVGTDGSTGVIASGGGWGHNVGFSQYGAHGRGRAGQTFMQILKSYYTGVGIGSYPLDIVRTPTNPFPTVRQMFMSPDARGILEIRPSGGLQGMRIHVNKTTDLTFSASQLANSLLRVDLTPYLSPGPNIVTYTLQGRTGTARVVVLVD